MLLLELRIGLRYALVGRGDRFVSFTSLASALGIALGVAAVIVVMSVMNGYHTELREKFLSFSSHVELRGEAGEALRDWEKLAAAAAAEDGVVAVAPLIDRQGLISAGAKVAGAVVKGVMAAQEAEVTAIDRELLDRLEPGAYRVLVGSTLARNLGAEKGDRLALFAPRGVATIAGLIPRMRAVETAGTVTFGIYQYDSALVYMNFDDAAALFGANGADSIRLRLEDVFAAPQIAARLAEKLGVRAYDWTMSNATLFEALAIERRVMFVILTLIIVVAAFQIVSALVAMVRSKRGDIAILRTIGVSPASLMRVFIFQGMLVGITGTLAGVVLGLLGADNLNAIVGLAEDVFGTDLFPGKVYFLEEFPSRIVPTQVALSAAVALAVTLAATIFPSLAAARADPAEALRHE